MTAGCGCSWARVLHMQASAEAEFAAGFSSREHRPSVKPAVQIVVRRSSKEPQEGETSMSSTRARISAEAARAGDQESLLELLAPDREPRLQPYGHPAVARGTHLRNQLDEELLSLRSDR